MRFLLAAVAVCLPLLASDPVIARRGQDASVRAVRTRNAIVGKVVDPTGKPVSGAVVTLVERDTVHGVVRFHFANAQWHVLTDDRGEYHIDQIRLGEFYVVAIPRNTPLTPDGKVNQSGYAITYHPSARRAGDAKPVMVNVREAQTADITLAPSALATVSGTVVASDNQRARGGTMGIAHGDNLFGIDTKGIRLRPDGSFLLAGMPPGTYFLQFHEGPWPPPRDAPPLVSGAKVVVDGKNLTGVRVVPIHMVHATGRVIVDSATRSSLQPSAISVGGNPVSFEGNPGPQRPGRVRDDLTFEFATWPGPGYVRLGFDASGWKVKTIRHKGVDVTDTGIDFKEGQDISGIEIELVKADGRGPG